MANDRDALPLRGVYAKVKVCCEEMREAIKDYSFVESEWLRGTEAPAPSLTLEYTELSLVYCWACGTKIVLEPELS
jgi:hypothetical protein